MGGLGVGLEGAALAEVCRRAETVQRLPLCCPVNAAICTVAQCSLPPVHTPIFHLPWGSSFGTAFLWRSLELIILYFILLYKQQSSAKEHNHRKKPLWGWGGCRLTKQLFEVGALQK